MNGFALAQDFTRKGRYVRARQPRVRAVALPWTEVPVARFVAPAYNVRGGWVLAGLLAAMAIGLHAGLVWYVTHHVTTDVPPRPHVCAGVRLS